MKRIKYICDGVDKEIKNSNSPEVVHALLIVKSIIADAITMQIDSISAVDSAYLAMQSATMQSATIKTKKRDVIRDFRPYLDGAYLCNIKYITETGLVFCQEIKSLPDKDYVEFVNAVNDHIRNVFLPDFNP